MGIENVVENLNYDDLNNKHIKNNKKITDKIFSDTLLNTLKNIKKQTKNFIKINTVIGIISLSNLLGGNYNEFSQKTNAGILTFNSLPLPISVSGLGYTLMHYSKASNDIDSFDMPFTEISWPSLEMYQPTDFEPPFQRLAVTSQNADSYQTVSTILEGNNLTEPIGALICPEINSIDNENNYEKRNIIAEYYEATGDSFPEFSFSRTFDIKDLALKQGFIYANFHNRISGKLDILFYNYADINRDKKVDFEDYAILAKNWGRTGIDNYEPNILDNYADINRDGKVDITDLALFSEEWMEKSY